MKKTMDKFKLNALNSTLSEGMKVEKVETNSVNEMIEEHNAYYRVSKNLTYVITILSEKKTNCIPVIKRGVQEWLSSRNKTK